MSAICEYGVCAFFMKLFIRDWFVSLVLTVFLYNSPYTPLEKEKNVKTNKQEQKTKLAVGVLLLIFVAKQHFNVKFIVDVQ